MNLKFTRSLWLFLLTTFPVWIALVFASSSLVALNDAMNVPLPPQTSAERNALGGGGGNSNPSTNGSSPRQQPPFGGGGGGGPRQSNVRIDPATGRRIPPPVPRKPPQFSTGNNANGNSPSQSQNSNQPPNQTNNNASPSMAATSSVSQPTVVQSQATVPGAYEWPDMQQSGWRQLYRINPPQSKTGSIWNLK